MPKRAGLAKLSTPLAMSQSVGGAQTCPGGGTQTVGPQGTYYFWACNNKTSHYGTGENSTVSGNP